MSAISVIINLTILQLFLNFLTLSIINTAAEAALLMSRDGCGHTKGCLFKPAGCDPQLDCSIALIFFVSSPNKLNVQLMAQSLVPVSPLQYIAIGFSEDIKMGNDMVTECILSPEGNAFSDIEVFASYNLDRGHNDRTWLNSTERSLLYSDIEGGMVDGRLYCSFNIAIRPQFSKSRIWNLDKKYWIMGATGSAQPDEINAHDTSLGSHYYPVVSARAIEPSRIGHSFQLPARFGGGGEQPKSGKVQPQQKAADRNLTATKAENTVPQMHLAETRRDTQSMFKGIQDRLKMRADKRRD